MSKNHRFGKERLDGSRVEGKNRRDNPLWRLHQHPKLQLQQYNVTERKHSSDSSTAWTAHSVTPLLCLLNKGAVSFCTFAVHQAVCMQGFEGKRPCACLNSQSFFERAALPHRYALSRDIHLLGTYHCVFYLCCPKPVSADVNDIIHPPCYLIIAFLGPVSTIPREVVTYSKDTRVVSSRKCASLLLWALMQNRLRSGMAKSLGWIKQLTGIPKLTAAWPATHHFPLLSAIPNLCLLCLGCAGSW